MPEYESLKHRLAQISSDTETLLNNAGKMIELADEGFANWQATCRTISAQISGEIMRVAVVGAIKSGKSTFVNALFGGDYLKRGAGVVTSIVTRARAGSRLRATLYLKTWDAVNRDINQAAMLLPADNRPAEALSYDIRREADRQELSRALNALAADQLIANDTRSPGSVLLSCYLKGYETIREWVADDPATVEFEDQQFGRHRDFVGEDTLAVYLRDVQLEIAGPGMGPGVEMADCQGSDSPNPLHLAMIQDYLMLAHLSIYVISSRTGLRQADIRFLSMIRSMGILDTVAFVVNCDFSEHDSLEDLVAGIRKIEDDLRLLCPEPRVFVFSALFALMSRVEAELPEREKERYRHWRREEEMVAFAEEQRGRFARFLDHKINRERSRLLLKNHLDRLEVVTAGINGWIDFNTDLLTRDADGVHELLQRTNDQNARLDRLKTTVRNALDGAAGRIKQELKSAIDRFFQEHGSGVVDGVVEFIRGYQVEMQRHEESLNNSGFAQTLYLVFQEFRQAVDAYMAESVNPKVMNFIKSRERLLADHLDEIAGPFGAMIDEAMRQILATAEEDAGMQPRAVAAIRIGPAIESIRAAAGLVLPPAATTMRYSTQIKTEAVMRFGFYKIVNLIKKAMKKSVDKDREERVLALASGVKRMKRETERSVLFHLKDYKENIKFQYMLKLVDAAAAALYQQVQAHFQHHGADLSNLAAMMGAKRLDKEKMRSRLKTLGADSQTLRDAIVGLRKDMERLNG
jgi:hypothetical protein